jgi:FAM194 protein
LLIAARRLSISPFGGIELNSAGMKRHCWRWNDTRQHVHAPPLYPLSMPLSSSVLLRINTQYDMTITFSSAHRACRFNVGARRKVSLNFAGVYESLIGLYCPFIQTGLLSINYSRIFLNGLRSRTTTRSITSNTTSITNVDNV